MAKPAGTTLVPQLWISLARPVGAGRTDRNEQSRQDRTDHGAGERADDESSKGRPGHGRCDHGRSDKDCRERPRRSDTPADRGRKSSKTHRSDDAGGPAGMRCHAVESSVATSGPVTSVKSISADSKELTETLLAAVGAAAFQ
ncbi:hypothetical protein [Streptomyces mirabilis]|uniref:hypothetical protein n=1 Tax=Streptomyces mirabilis TaxID=68239 RepID=UPI0036D84D2B